MLRLIYFLVVLILPIELSAVELRGELVQGALVLGHAMPGSEITLGEQRVGVTGEGLFALGFDRDAPATLPLVIKSPDGKVETQQLQIVPREYNIQRIEGIAKRIMNPSKENLKRIRQEALEVRRARARHLDRTDFAGEFHWPLKGPITGVFGSQRVYNGRPSRPHYGVDVAAATGTPVSTPAKGLVTLAHQGMFYSGGTLIIDHGYGVSSTLMHLSKILVNVGDEVKPGDIVAKVGATGRATGPHLDWRMNWFKSRIDPQRLVPIMVESQ